MIEGQKIRGACSPTTYPYNPAMIRLMLSFFYADEDTDPERIEEAKRICSKCEARQECIDTYLSEKHGVFGGKTATERLHIRREARRR